VPGRFPQERGVSRWASAGARRLALLSHQNVARGQLIGPIAEDRCGDQPCHRRQVDWLRKRLGSEPQLTIEQGAREIGASLNVCREGGLPQRCGHLIGSGVECASHNFKLNRVHQ